MHKKMGLFVFPLLLHSFFKKRYEVSIDLINLREVERPEPSNPMDPPLVPGRENKM